VGGEVGFCLLDWAAMGAAATGSRAGRGQLFRDGFPNAGGAEAAADQGAFANLFTLLDQDLAEVVDDWRFLATSTTHELAAIHDRLASHALSSQDLALLLQCCQQPSFVRQTSILRQSSLGMPPRLDQDIIVARQMSCEQDYHPPPNRTNFLGPLADAPMPGQAGDSVVAPQWQPPL